MQTQSSPPEGMSRNGSLRKFRMGPCEFEAESRYLTLRLQESNDVLGDAKALRARFDTDGYLFIRGFHDRNEVLSVRREILEIMAADGQLDPAAPREDGVINPGQQTQAGVSTRGRENLKTESLRRLLYGAK